ncbi:hypothetical protein EFL77_01415 [Pediococcus pentosaceus]|nr:hypothetical protein [Pediococcus pentosaceus]
MLMKKSIIKCIKAENNGFCWYGSSCRFIWRG